MKLSPLALDLQEMVQSGMQEPRQEFVGARSAHHAGRAIPETDSSRDSAVPRLHHVIEAVESYMQSLGVNLKFHIDERTDVVQVEVRDPDTDKLIRKIPADEMLDLAASIEKMLGLFLNRTL